MGSVKPETEYKVDGIRYNRFVGYLERLSRAAQRRIHNDQSINIIKLTALEWWETISQIYHTLTWGQDNGEVHFQTSVYVFG